MNIQILAILLLIGRIASEGFTIAVLRRQWKIRKTRTHPRLIKIRRVLNLLAVLVFIGNIYPLILDVYTIFRPEVRTTQFVNVFGVFYSLDFSITFMIASMLIWALYKLSDIVIEVAELVTGQTIISPPENK